MRPAAAPSSISCADDLLETARQLIDDDSAATQSDPRFDVSCHAGCSDCCSQAVPVRLAELRSIADYIEQLPDSRQQVLRWRIDHTASALERAGIDATEVPAIRLPNDDDFPKRYFRAKVACPLLEDDGTCGVRPVRPLACREFLVTSDPKHCADLSEQIVRIRSDRDLIAGYTKVSEHLGEPAMLVLATALAKDIPPAPRQRPVAGGAMLRLLTAQRSRQSEP